MNAKDLLTVVKELLANNPTDDAWQIYYKVRVIDDSVTQHRVARALDKTRHIKTRSKVRKFQTDCFLPVQYSAKKYDE
jgi:hypothetical protein